MFKKLLLFFIFSFLSAKAVYGCDPNDDLRAELQQIRNQTKAQIPQSPDDTVFAVSDSLTKAYRGLSEKVCNKVWSDPDFQDLQQNLCVALCGSVAWGEPTLKSDIEIILLLNDYKHFPKTLQFTKALLKAFEKLGDPHFVIDAGNKHSKGELPYGLENSLWTFTPQDAVDYAFKNDSTVVSAFLTSLESALEAPQGSLNNYSIQPFFGERIAIGFRKECLNVSYLSGNKEILEQYAQLRSQKLSNLHEFYDIQELISPILYESVGGDYKAGIENKVKCAWRHVSNVIRTLGLLTESSEIGSLKTLDLLKEKGLLRDETYNDLLRKAQTHVWARLMTSTGIDDKDSFMQHLDKEKFCMHSFYNNELSRGNWFVRKESKL